MQNNNWIDYKIEIKERLKSFSLQILQLSGKIPVSISGKVINYQITKSGTSMYANFRSALRARSKAEFFSKLSIAVEETDETEMWLDLILSSGIVKDESVVQLHLESIELLRILSRMRKRIAKD